jgi:chromosome partitioning protein
MTRIVSIVSFKGGVGKTTSTINIAATLAYYKNQRVLVFDGDPQGNAGLCLDYDPVKVKKTIFDVVVGDADIKDIIQKTKYIFDIVPSNMSLSNIEPTVNENKEVYPKPHFIFRDLLAPIKDDYDYIFIDLPPGQTQLTINGLACSTDVLVPMQCEFLATAGVIQILDVINQVKKAFNHDLNLLGIIPTMFNVRTIISTESLQDARKYCDKKNIPIFNTVINRYVKYSEATRIGEPAVIAYKDNEQMRNYITLTEEAFAL